MKKRILLVILLLLLCGCSAEVDLKINDTSVEETVTIDAYSDQTMSKTMVYQSFRKYIPAFYDVVVPDLQEDAKVKGVSYYERTEKELENGYRFKYYYNFPFQSYNKARSVKNSFKSSFISKDEKGVITISTDNAGNILIRQYPELSSIKVKIHTDGYQVLESNGVLENGYYTWVFSQNDNNKSIYLKLEKRENNTENKANPEENKAVSDKKKEDESFINKHPFLFIFCGLGLFFILVFLFLRAKSNKYE